MMGAIQVFDSIGHMQSTATPFDVNQVYFCKGYADSGDNGGGLFTWVSALTGPDDAFTFASTGFPNVPGLFLRHLPGVTEFSLPMGGIFANTPSFTAPQGAALGALYEKVKTANQTLGFGIKTFVLPPNYDLIITDRWVLRPNQGSPAVLGSGPTTRLIGAAEGENASALDIKSTFVGDYDSVPYGPNTWTEDLHNQAGKTTTTAMDSVVGLLAGQKVCVRYGADPTDGSLAYWYHFDEIVSVAGNIVTFRAGLPGNVSATAGINVNRLVDKHDILILDQYCDHFEIGGFATHNVHLAPSFSNAVRVHDVKVEYGTQCFSVAFDTDSRLENLQADYIGAVTGNTSWFLQGWSHQNLLLNHFSCVMGAASNVFSQESQNRGSNVSNGRVIISSDVANVELSLSAPGSIVRWTNLVLDGGVATVIADSNCYFTNLDIRGQVQFRDAGPNWPLDCNIGANQIGGNLFFRGLNWSRIVTAPRQTLQLVPAVSGTRNVQFTAPLRGIPRRIAIRCSTLTGITVFLQSTPVGTNFDLLPGLVAGQFIQQQSSVLLGINFPGGYNNGVPAPNLTTFLLQTDTTVPAGATIDFDMEYFETDDSSWVAAQSPRTSSGIVAPTGNADFVGQWFLDTVAGKWYVSVQTGFGAADWVAA